jgi:hypothetical protein
VALKAVPNKFREVRIVSKQKKKHSGEFLDVKRMK